MSKNNNTIDVLIHSIREVIGEDWILEMDIDYSTSFNEDLELESIEFVSLAEKLQETYGESVKFVDWLSGKKLDEIIGLTVGDVANFIDGCVSVEPAGAIA